MTREQPSRPFTEAEYELLRALVALLAKPDDLRDRRLAALKRLLRAHPLTFVPASGPGDNAEYLAELRRACDRALEAVRLRDAA